MTVHMSETIQKDYGVNLNIKYHKDITRAWDKCQEEVREQTRARRCSYHCDVTLFFKNKFENLSSSS